MAVRDVGKKLLLVDDDAVFCKAFLRHRSHWRGSVAAAGTFDEADDILRRNSPDVALIDIDLKDREGRLGIDLITEARSLVTRFVALSPRMLEFRDG